MDQNEEKGEFTSKVGDISLGMTFDNEDDAYNYYNAYGRRVGFSVRKNRENKDRSGVLKKKQFCCSCEGFYKKKKELQRRKEKKQDVAARQYLKSNLI